MNQLYSQYKVSALKLNKNLLMKVFLFFNICLLAVPSLWGQSAFHAVQVNVNLIPPYSLYLDDYTTGTRDRIMVTLINKDVQYPSMQVRLKLTAKANGFTLKTNDYAVITPIILEPNIPYRLSREEIAEYFDPKNLTASGMGTSVWRQDRKLPEGMIEFSFEAYEHLSNIKLSLPGSGLAWVSTQKPPQLSLPFNEESVSYRDPLNLMFQWTPRHTGIANVEYIFILKQLWDNGLKAEAAWAYSTEIIRETVKPTSFLYGAAMPALTPGMRYAWAVQAVAKDGIDDVRVFENNGLSEIRSFTLADYCPPPTSINAKTDNGRIALEWVPLPEHIDFSVSYRQKGVEAAEWFYTKTILPKVILYDVRPGYTYEYRIGSSCKPDSPVYGEIYSIAVPTRDTAANCGKTGGINASNTDLLPTLGPNEMFMAADFPVYVTLASGANGIFSGEGYTIMPDMFVKAKLRVKWDNISINTDRRMIKGWVDAIYDEENSQIANLDDIFEGGTTFGTVKQGISKADVDLSFTITEDSDFTFNPNDGTITVIDESGNESTIDISQLIADREITGEGEKSIFPITIKDKDGNIYEIDIDQSKGPADLDSGNPVNLTAKPIGKETAPIREGAVNYENIAENKAVVTFEKAGKYAFDSWEDYYNGALLIEDKYEKIGNYHVPFKLLPPGKTDIVTARIDIKDSGVNPNQVIFKTPAGTEFNYTYEDNRYTITLTGGISGDGQEVYALYPGGDGYFNLGKLLVLSYPEKTFNLVAVNVNNANVDVTALSNKLNEIYNPFGISWKVTGDTCSYSGSTQFMEQGSKLLTAYPDAMKAFQNEYLSKRNIEGKTACLFFFNRYGAGAKNRDADGFMPRNKQFGYMFTQGFASADELFIGAAHELGHGVFVLKHTFDKDYGIAEKATNNLMDYSVSATHIAKWQWDLIHDPGVVVRVFERDEEAMAINKDGSQFIDGFISSKWIKSPVSEGVFLTMAGFPMWIENIDEVCVITSVEGGGGTSGGTWINIGAIIGFKLKTGESYYWDGKGYFKGFYSKSKNKYYPNKKTLEYINIQEEGKYITRFKLWNVEADGFEDYVKEFSFEYKEFPENWYSIGSGTFSRDIYPQQIKLWGDITSEKELIEKSASNRQSFWNKNVEDVAALVQAMISKKQYISVPKYLEDDELTMRLLNDKFISYNSNTNKNIYIIGYNVGYGIPNDSVNLFTKQVSEKAGLDNNSILVTIPFALRTVIATNQKGEWHGGQRVLFPFPGSYGADTPIEVPPHKDFKSFVSEFYKLIPKPKRIFTYIVRYDGMMEFYEHNSVNDVVGYDYVCKLRYYIDREVHTTINFYKEKKSMKEVISKGQLNEHNSPAMYHSKSSTYYHDNSFNKAATAFLALSDREPQINDYIEQKINLLESHIPNNHQAWVINDFIKQYPDIKEGLDISIPQKVDDSFLIHSKEGDWVLNTIDVFSVLTSFFGGDIIFDAAGALYCYVKGDHALSSIYAGAVIIPVASGGAGKGLTKLGEKIVQAAGKKVSRKTLIEMLESIPYLEKSYAKKLSDIIKTDDAKSLLALINELDLLGNNATHLVKEIVENESLRKLIISEPERIFGAYKLLLRSRQTGKDAVKYLDDFMKLTPEAQIHIARYSDVTLPKFLNELSNPDILKFVNDPSNEIYLRGFVSHKGLDQASKNALLEDIGEHLAQKEFKNNIEETFVRKMLQHSDDFAKFGHYSDLGQSLSTKIARDLRLGLQGNNSNLLNELSGKLGIKIDELRKYDILTEVPLITPGGYMKADIMFVKKNAITNKVEDAIIIENKLSKGTNYTPRQKEGFGAIINGQTSMKIEYGVSGNKISLDKNDVIPVSKDKIYRFYDGGTDDISNVTIEKITKI